MKELLAEIAKLVQKYETANGEIIGCEVIREGQEHWYDGKGGFTNTEKLATAA